MPKPRQHRILLAAVVAAVVAGAVAAGIIAMLRRGRARATGSARAAATGIPVTPSTGSVNPADSPMGRAGENAEQRLDEGIQETFPASDPVSVKIE
jgi:hypothetical protein